MASCGQWCVQREASDALALDPPFFGAPLEVLRAYNFLILVNNLLFTHIMYYKADHK